MSTEENTAVIRRLMEEFWNQGKVETLDAVFAPNFVHRTASPGMAPTREGLKEVNLSIRAAFTDGRSPSFVDHFSQAAMFWRGQSDAEKEHLVEAGQFELGNCDSVAVWQRVIDNFNQVDHELATRIAAGIGIPEAPVVEAVQLAYSAPEVSVERTFHDSIKTRKVAALLANGFDGRQLDALRAALEAEGAALKVVAKVLGPVKSASGQSVPADKTFHTGASIMFDGVYVPGGAAAIEALLANGDALHFVSEAYRHGKPIAATAEGIELLSAAKLSDVTLAGDSAGDAVTSDRGVVTSRKASAELTNGLIEALKAHRFFLGRAKESVPA